jgi:hypothetical protein
MRPGPRIVLLALLLLAVSGPRALAATSLSVYADNNSISVGGITTFAAHAETDAGFGGGWVAFKYRGADSDCAATPAEDPGADASEQPFAVAPGAAAVDVGGQSLQLDVGNTRICGWLVDQATGAVVASGSTVVQVLGFQGSISIRVARVKNVFQVTLAYATSAPARLYATLQRAKRQCPRSPDGIGKHSVLLTPRGGRLVPSDGGMGKAVPRKRLARGKWRVCTWLSSDYGSAGPASKTFVRR